MGHSFKKSAKNGYINHITIDFWRKPGQYLDFSRKEELEQNLGDIAV